MKAAERRVEARNKGKKQTLRKVNDFTSAMQAKKRRRKKNVDGESVSGSTSMSSSFSKERSSMKSDDSKNLSTVTDSLGMQSVYRQPIPNSSGSGNQDKMTENKLIGIKENVSSVQNPFDHESKEDEERKSEGVHASVGEKLNCPPKNFARLQLQRHNINNSYETASPTPSPTQKTKLLCSTDDPFSMSTKIPSFEPRDPCYNKDQPKRKKSLKASIMSSGSAKV